MTQRAITARPSSAGLGQPGTPRRRLVLPRKRPSARDRPEAPTGVFATASRAGPPAPSKEWESQRLSTGQARWRADGDLVEHAGRSQGVRVPPQAAPFPRGSGDPRSTAALPPSERFRFLAATAAIRERDGRLDYLMLADSPLIVDVDGRVDAMIDHRTARLTNYSVEGVRGGPRQP